MIYNAVVTHLYKYVYYFCLTLFHLILFNVKLKYLVIIFLYVTDVLSIVSFVWDVTEAILEIKSDILNRTGFKIKNTSAKLQTYVNLLEIATGFLIPNKTLPDVSKLLDIK